MMESPWESQRAEAENGELLSVEESDHEGERLVHKQPVEIVKIHEGKLHVARLVKMAKFNKFLFVCFIEKNKQRVRLPMKVTLRYTSES